MSLNYRTQDGDMLDYICWKYYIQDVNLNTAMMTSAPQLAAAFSVDDLQRCSSSLTYGSSDEQSMRGTVEAVLAANPGLAQYPLELPAGLNIYLPDLDEQAIDDNRVKLWD